ncbi:Tigger transposable element-derived protein 7-like 63 [Homarus americanus]|uniref:Tigger transposable element-derived protein 7-like 63 n=1 Tax=Homarus americanus TaxID=6706 RepID=A0A8J5JET9_HOMAM|nr:Tigger transposable element-derived protein 7-like 63 [Homarus americanus]
MRVAKDTNLEEAVTKWFVQQQSCGNVVRGVEIQAAAAKLASHMGIENFEASDGWLWRFRNRHGMCNKITNAWKKFLHNVERVGENDVTEDDIRNWLEDTEGDPGYQVLTEEEIADEVLVGDSRDSEDEEDDEPLPKKPKLSVIRESIDNVISQFVPALLQLLSLLTILMTQAILSHLSLLRVGDKDQWSIIALLTLNDKVSPLPPTSTTSSSSVIYQR